MIEVYVRNVTYERGELLGEFTPKQISLLPSLFETFVTFDSSTGEELTYAASQFVIYNGSTVFEILVEKED